MVRLLDCFAQFLPLRPLSPGPWQITKRKERGVSLRYAPEPHNAKTPTDTHQNKEVIIRVYYRAIFFVKKKNTSDWQIIKCPWHCQGHKC
jgi:hypothetical protein